MTLEQNALVRIYDNLHELKQLPSRLQFYLSKHLYLHASLLLLKSKDSPELRSLHVLAEIQSSLREERFSLEDRLCLELIDQLFEKPSRDLLTNKNLSSLRTEGSGSSRLRENRLLRKQLDQEFHEGKLGLESSSLAIIPDQYLLVDIRQQSPDLYLDVLIQSLAILFHLNETFELLQRKFPEHFTRIVQQTTRHILDSQSNLLLNNRDCLRELFEMCYEQFKSIVKNCEHLLTMFKAIEERQSPVQLKQEEYLHTQEKFGGCGFARLTLTHLLIDGIHFAVQLQMNFFRSTDSLGDSSTLLHRVRLGNTSASVE